jgi:hypothetical protein
VAVLFVEKRFANVVKLHKIFRIFVETLIPNKMVKNIKKRLEYLKEELRQERISYGELAELSSLVKYIDLDDTELLEAAGVPEFPENTSDINNIKA